MRENIVCGLDRAVTQDEIEAVFEEANAHEFIFRWLDGYDALVGEHEIQLSGGQRQRTAIARVLEILLREDTTRALDSESKHLVKEAIDKAVDGSTVLIVAPVSLQLNTFKHG